MKAWRRNNGQVSVSWGASGRATQMMLAVGHVVTLEGEQVEVTAIQAIELVVRHRPQGMSRKWVADIQVQA